MASIASRTVKPAGFVGSTRKASDIELSYLGGFIDGEGSITISTGYWQRARNGYALHLSAVNVHPEPLRMLEARFGGKVFCVEPKQAGRLNHFRWGVVAKKAETAIRDLLPYLRVKADQARVALDFRNTYYPGSPRRPDPWLYAERDSYVELLQEMKRWEYA